VKRNIEYVKTTIELEATNVQWFRETYPFGSMNGLLNLLLQKFREVHAITPSDYATIGAKELKKLLEEGERT
jgi:hypothetical protein